MFESSSRLAVAVAVALLASGATSRLLAQAGATLATPDAAASSYQQTFDALWNLRPDRERGASVNGLTIAREGAVFELVTGQVNLLGPIGGRPVGFVWEGTGRFRLAMPDRAETDQIERYFKQRALDLPIKALVVFFTDSTAAEIATRVSLVPRDPLGDMQNRVREALEFLGDDDEKDLHVDLMQQVLNGRSGGLFIAHIIREGGDPAMFEVNPSEREGVRLFTRSKGTGGIRFRETVAAGPRAAEASEAWRRSRRGDVLVSRSEMQVALPNSSTGDVSFSATARLSLWADEPVGPWAPLALYYKLKVDSASWSDGTPATFFKGKDSGILWLRLPRELTPGDSLTLNLAYHGDLTDRYGDFFFIKAASAWYPRSLDYRAKSMFDITFRSPRKFALASIGELKDSTVEGSMMVTRWVTDRPVRNASFNFGILKAHRVAEQDVPPVTVLWSLEGHRAITQALLADESSVSQEKNVEKSVGMDVAAAMKFYQSVYGKAPMKAFYATETPTEHGEAFPGLVHLSYVTFVRTADQGWDEIFRAHEVAHQWWGIGVDFATYRDQWLAEGFSTFSGIWYLQASRKKSEPYFEELRRWKTGIIERAPKTGPISMGYRVMTARDGRDYQTMVYWKGAWVLHMLRTLLIDLKTMNEDHFTSVMREFYQTYNGQYASTADFQRVVEAKVGQPMGWFFNQWVYGTAIPTYRATHRFEPAGDGKYRVKLTVEQTGVPDDFQMYVPVTIELANGAQARMRVLVKGKRSDPELPLMPAQPKALKFNDFEGVLARVE